MEIKVWLLIATMVNGGEVLLPFIEKEWCIRTLQTLATEVVLNAQCRRAMYIATSIFAPETSPLPTPKPGMNA